MRPRLYCFASAVYSDLALELGCTATPDFTFELIASTDTKAIQYSEKSEAVLQALHCERWAGGQIMIYADADCRFFKPCADDVIARMEGREAIFQGDGKGGLATGFFAMRTTDKMLAFWDRVAHTKRFYEGSEWPGFDEAAVNEWKNEINWGLLPEDEYWTPCFPLRNSSFEGWNLPLEFPPKNARMVHLSCVRPPDKRRVMGQAIEHMKW
jgi:hypothetical protein